MLWHFEISPKEDFESAASHDVERHLAALGWSAMGPVEARRLYLLGGDFDEAAARRLGERLLCDEVVETCRMDAFDDVPTDDRRCVTVTRKAGVMEPAEESIRRGARRLGVELDEVRTGMCYRFLGNFEGEALETVARRLLANDVVDEILPGRRGLPLPLHPEPYKFRRIVVPLPDSDAGLMELSGTMGLSLNLEEMRTLRGHFAELGRDPTDVELETLAQTWSEHCKHKTFTARVTMGERTYENLLKETVFEATRRLDKDWCVSVFKDNAGIVRFDDDFDLCIKVETHNHPSAIEPYGGAGTGLGGVIRDILGTGLGGKPVANLDVFCVGRPEATLEDLPAGVHHPLRILEGVVAGVRDYGNRMGIPTVSGAVLFDERYTGNPLVFCGTVGLIPRGMSEGEARPGDLIVALGGRTGRDGIHGATFSSRELHEESESLDGGAVQIGNAITEKRMMDVLLAARDQNLFRAVTDCGAGGFSSAVGEMAEHTGADVELSKAPLKYPGLSYAEIWISEAQERMVLAVPPEHLSALTELCEREDVESCVLGEFTDTGRLRLFYEGESVADMDMDFLHNGLPRPSREATWSPPAPESPPESPPRTPRDALEALLEEPNLASKEWVIRQYDHEVQAGSCIKPLVGELSDGPGNGSVVVPRLGSSKGFALGLGVQPWVADLDPYLASTAALDEAVRNVVAVGGDPTRTCLLDNFSWGNTAKPDRLGALVLAAEGLKDAALAMGMPFVSGKDSLNNEYATKDGSICIPHTVVVTALALVPDVERTTTMDLKAAGNRLLLVGPTRDERGGSAWMRLHGRRGVRAPHVDLELAPRIHAAIHRVLRAGLGVSCHDLSDGGLALALAEMALAGGFGLDVDLTDVPRDEDLETNAILFSETPSRYILEVEPSHVDDVVSILSGLPVSDIGTVTESRRLRVRAGADGAVLDEDVDALAALFRSGLTRYMEGDHRD